MHYLKCNKCGHFNEVKTEYLALCSKCMTKLENSFSVWKVRNPDSTFDEYKNLVCTTSSNEDPIPTPRTTKSRGVKYWFSFAIAFALFYIIGQFGVPYLIGFFSHSQIDKAAVSMVTEINKNCPIMIDKETRLDNSITLPGKIFQYNYTLIHFSKDSIDLNGLKANMEPRILNFVKTNPQMKAIRDNNYTVNYYYSDKMGAYLFTISVKPEQYQ